MKNIFKEIIKLGSLIVLGLIISFSLSRITGREFTWWITVGAFIGGYLGSKLFKK